MQMSHYSDVIMGMTASLITSLTIVYSTVYLDADQRKHESSASLSFVRGIHRGPVNSPHKWPVTRKMFPFDYVVMQCSSISRHSEDFVILMCFVKISLDSSDYNNNHFFTKSWYFTSLRPNNEYVLVNLANIGLDNGMTPVRHQATFWINITLLSMGSLATNISEIGIKLPQFLSAKMNLKMSSSQYRPFHLRLNMLRMTGLLTSPGDHQA